MFLGFVHNSKSRGQKRVFCFKCVETMDSFTNGQVAPIETKETGKECEERTVRVPRKAWCEGTNVVNGSNKERRGCVDIVEGSKCDSAKEELKRGNDQYCEKHVSTGATVVSKASSKVSPFPGNSLPMPETTMVRSNAKLQREVTVKTLSAIQHFKRATKRFVVSSTDCATTCFVILGCNICFCAGVLCDCSWTKIHMRRVNSVYGHYCNNNHDCQEICCTCCCVSSIL